MKRTLRFSHTLLAILALLALVASACGDDDDDSAATGGDEPTEAAPAEGDEATDDSDEAPDDSDEPTAEGDEASDDSTEPADTDSTAGDEDATDESVESVDRLRLAGGNFGYPSPFAWARGPGWIQAGFVFDTLLWLDSTGSFIPWLATEWSASDDGTEWRFTLNPAATWHDGEPVTADDVVFTYEYMTSGAGAGKGSFAFSGFRQVASVTAEGDHEVVFVMKQPYAAFEEDLAASALILPEHVWADIDDPAERRGPEATMGSGPYILESADPASGSYLFTANEDFHLGPPVVKRLEFVPARDQLLAVETGEIDAAEIGLEQPIPPQQMEAFESNDALDQIQAPGDWNRALHFNLAAGFPYDELGFRHAVAYAIDRPDLIDRILFGRGVPASLGGLAPTHPFLADDLPTYEHDPEEANRLLDEIGLVDADGDGIRDLPDGSAFNPQLKSSGFFSTDTPQLIREYLLQVGLDVEVVILDRATADEAGVQGDYTLQLHGYANLGGDPDWLRQRFADQESSTLFFKAWGYQNDRFDELAAAQLATLDTEARKEIVVEMQQILAEDVPVLPLYVPDRILFYDPDTFANWYNTPGCSPCFASRNKHMYVTGMTEGF